MNEQDRKTDETVVTAPKLKVQGTAVIRRADGTIRTSFDFEGEAPLSNFTKEEADHGSDS